MIKRKNKDSGLGQYGLDILNRALAKPPMKDAELGPGLRSLFRLNK